MIVTTENEVDGHVREKLVGVLGILYAIMYGPEASLFAELFVPKVRYSGISFVYQFSGIFASGLTPLILTYLLDVGNGPGLMIAYFLIVGAISTVCTLMIRHSDLVRIQEAEAAPALVE